MRFKLRISEFYEYFVGGRMREVYVLVAITVFAVYLRFSAVLCCCRTAKNRIFIAKGVLVAI